METIKDVLCFLNEVDFFEQKYSDVIEKFRCLKQRLVIKFEKNNVSKLIYFSNDGMNVSIITNDFVEKKTTHYEKIFYI